MANDVLKAFPEMRRLPASVFNPKGGVAGRVRLLPETVGIHHYAASWFNWKQCLAYIWWPKIRNCAMRLLGRRDD